MSFNNCGLRTGLRKRGQWQLFKIHGLFLLFLASFGVLAIAADQEGDPPGLSGNDGNGNLSKAQAAHFLTQATFGPTLEAIQDLVALGGYEAWLDEQFNQPVSLQLPATQTLVRQMCDSRADSIDGNFQEARVNAWWNTVINGNDQLRQRVAFALSEIFVVSAVGPLSSSQYGLANYNDMLIANAFGNYRELLEDVTLHPAMGIYLSMLRNEKAQPEKNIRPDENYAREVMQLFSIGVHELNLNGTLKLADGQPIPTYGQTDIEEFAKVFTGWNFANTSWTAWIGQGDRTRPMEPIEAFHDTGEKQLLNGVLLQANRTARQDLDVAMDNLFTHSNVGPFIGKQLIQRLVTSNPINSYVARVAAIFNDNGRGVRGDLKAVIKAILLDDEARTGHLNSTTFGKVREPMLRLSHLRRAFPAIPMVREGERWGSGTCGQNPYELYTMPLPFPWDFRLVSGQDILRAPSVFNFFLPDFAPPGPISDQALVAPEFQIMTENTLTGFSHAITYEIQNSNESVDWTVLNTTKEEALADDTTALLDRLDLVLLSGTMTTEMRGILADHLNNGDFPADSQRRRAAKARDAITLIISSPSYLIQQ
ncbi:MAG: DUF1800 domain-containing protein [Methylococcales bacterium]